MVDRWLPYLAKVRLAPLAKRQAFQHRVDPRTKIPLNDLYNFHIKPFNLINFDNFKLIK